MCLLVCTDWLVWQEALLCGLLRCGALDLHGPEVGGAVAGWVGKRAWRRCVCVCVTLCVCRGVNVEEWRDGRPTTTGRLRHQCVEVE